MTLREFAQKYGLDAQELFEILIFEKFPISGVEDDIDDRVAEYLLQYVDDKKGNRKSKGVKKIIDGSKSKTANRENRTFESRNRNKSYNEPAPAPRCVAQSMTVGMLASACAIQASQIITYWIKKGKLYSVNHELSVEEVRESAAHFSISVDEPPVQRECSSSSAHVAHGALSSGASCRRMPVIVVVGHVDHGKTTLLDYIRKTTVAAGEKGGITQHIGAYKAHVAGHGDMVFIDTPGHEAFTSMRVRGLSVADVAILVVAADDGIMPQTIEAIRAAQSLNLTIVVALNKIDKVSQKEIDKAYQQLAEYGLTPEAWGGSTTCVHISASKGTGISELLEVLYLTAELLDLRANSDALGAGYILEAKQEKGRGFVATIILQHGTLSVGDSFYVGGVFGKIMSIVDGLGSSLMRVGPSEPVRISGFDSLPEVGQALHVASAKEAKEKASFYLENQERAQQNKITSGGSGSGNIGERILNLVVKADTSSSLHALVTSIKKVHGKYYYNPVVVASSIGDLVESDVAMAATTKSIVYMLHVNVGSHVLSLASEYGVEIRRFDIIYELLEDLEKFAEKARPPKMVEKKIGDVLVLKVFAIKNFGVVAGFRVLNGIVIPGTKVVVTRGKQKVFTGGTIKTLQRDRANVKEVTKGYEGAFLVDGFTDWMPEDRVEIFQEVLA